ncbi:MAG: glycosyltransferase [Rhodoferax sp.]|uniref:glycosyltransferase n=1 Tax=Rhodoferax sp. TaxID=50421 RepID=UPI0026392FDF|nr:glycosyltransferase [Rhodoferax sp.]MDD5334875.1 glycosyltransferase [Rhodoferax sp.]
MRFSVLMAVYFGDHSNCLADALSSLCHQTRFPDEVVLVEDGPIPLPLSEVIDHFRKRLNIKSIQLKENSGLAIALNTGLACCMYDLVARMDSDDISLPDRFAKQIAFMESHPEIAVSSASLQEFDDSGNVFSSRVLPLNHNDLISFAKLRSPISHAVAIFRKEAVMGVGGYPLFRRSQDVALWSTLIMQGYKLANLPDVLYRVRANSAFMARSGLRNFKFEYAVVRYQYRIGFLTYSEFLKSVSVRFGLAVMPQWLKQYAYKYSRI